MAWELFHNPPTSLSPVRVKMRKFHSEHFSTAVPQKADVVLNAANGSFVPLPDSCAAANDGELGRRKGETGAFALLIDHHRRGEWVQTARFLFTFLFAVMAIIRCCWFFRWRMPSPPKVLYGVAASQTL